jgi:hypothetical protein
MTFVGVNLLGPINYLPNSVYFTIFGLILLGPCEVIISLSSVEDYINTIVYDLKYKRDEANDIASSVYSLSTSLGDAVGPIIGGFFTERNGFVDACKYVSLQNLLWFAVFTIFSLKEIKYQLDERKMKKKDDKGTELIEIKDDNNLENEEEEEEGNENEDYEEGDENDDDAEFNENEDEDKDDDKIKVDKNEDEEDEKVINGNNENENNNLSNKDNINNENDENKMTMDETRRCSFDDDKINNADKDNNNNNDENEIVLDVIENDTK